MNVVRLEGVSYAYASTGSVGAPLVGARPSTGGHEGRPYVLTDVNLAIGAGELVLVSGHAGAGTSTLLLVAGGYAPRLTGGELTGSRTLAAKQPSIVFATPWTQLTGLCHTVAAEVAFGPASFGRPAGYIRDVVRQALVMLGIAHLSHRDPSTLSGGELQRVIVASALALEPDLLLLDDPAAELDPEAADSLYELLRTIAGSGTAIMVATPDLERGTRVASRALVLESGRIIHDGSPAEVPA